LILGAGTPPIPAVGSISFGTAHPFYGPLG
jgi:hypothetical protein